ncbi:MAG: pilus assembly protein TadG-related protein [Gemmatimonadota bacterium]
MSDSMQNERKTLWRRWRSDQRGSVSVIVALSMSALLALLALGIDLGALFDARSEAQRAADAAALAGASAFLDFQQAQAHQAAVSRATEFATGNEIRSEPIAVEDVSVAVDVGASTVRARVRRNGVPTWFARLVGIDSVDIGAEATAWAGSAGAAQCVKPFAVPDMWEERSDDLNGNRLWDDGERWSYDPGSGDRYAGHSGGGGGVDETGYGSGWRDGRVDADGNRFDGDYGRRITIKVTNPRDAFVPSFFLPWVLPGDDGQASCGVGGPGGGNGGGGNGNGGGDGGSGGSEPDGDGDATEPPGEGNGGGLGWLKWWEKREDLGVPSGGGGGNGGGAGGAGGGGTSGGTGGGVRRVDGPRGAAAYRRNICSCNRSVIDLDSEYLIEPGNMVGPTHQGVNTLIAQDPDAYWDDRTGTVVSEYGMDSPRVVTVGLFNPGEITRPGRQYIRFNNFARVFIEEQESRQDPVTGRFLYYVRGAGLAGRAGETTGSLVRVLQLIK